MKNLLTLLIITLLSFFLSSCSLSEAYNPILEKETHSISNSQVACTSPIFNVVDGFAISGSSNLRRNKNTISMNYKVEDLTPGYAYTVWWVIWNNPESCSTPNACIEPDFAIADDVKVEVLYAAGNVVGGSGKGNFSGSLKENDTSGSINESVFGLPSYGGLLDAQNAEVHLVLRSHGPAIPGEVNEQINTYPGGCSINFPAFTEIPDEVGECGDYMAAIFAPDCG